MKPGGLSQAELDALFTHGGTRPEADPELAAFPNLEPAGDEAPGLKHADPGPIGMLASVEIDVAVHLGQTRLSIRDILSMAPGSVLELDRLAGEAVDVLANGRLVARGEVVVIGENFGVRISELISAAGGKVK